MNKIFKQLNCEIILKSFLHEEGEFVFSQEILNFIFEKMNEDDKKACLHLNKGDITELMTCPPDSVMKAHSFLPEMMAILCNSILKKIGNFIQN